jgi:signal peptide peptidase SppA
MRVIGYLESSFWTMRSAEFGTMMRVAYSHADRLDSLLSAESKERPASMLATPGQRLEGTRYVEMRGSIAVIDVNGIIAKRMDMFDEVCFGGTSTEKLMKDFKVAMDDPKVESIVMNIDSPGGEAFGINELAQSIYDARGRKPIKAYVGGLGCSGAYWIASAADEVISDKSALLGSIGVVTAWTDDTEMYKMLGIRKETIVSSNAPKKRLNFDEPGDRAELQKELDSIEKVFHKAVARNRGVKIEQVINDFNQGGVLAGKDAVDSGMADRVGSLEGVIKELQSKRNKTMAASASAAHEGDIEMGFRDTLRNWATEAGFKVEDQQDTPGDEADVKIVNGEDEAAGKPPAVEPTELADADKPIEESVSIGATADMTAALEQLQAFKANAIQTEATSFVDVEIKAGRLYPSEKESATALYASLASMDDTSALESFKAMQSQRKPHGLTDETIDADANKIVLGTGAEMPVDRQKELLSKSHLGNTALKIVDKQQTAKA